jgi:hypothetical protein
LCQVGLFCPVFHCDTDTGPCLTLQAAKLSEASRTRQSLKIDASHRSSPSRILLMLPALCTSPTSRSNELIFLVSPPASNNRYFRCASRPERLPARSLPRPDRAHASPLHRVSRRPGRYLGRRLQSEHGADWKSVLHNANKSAGDNHRVS